MKKELLLVCLLGSILMSCHSDLKLEELDPTIQADMGLALKIGSVTATLGDFVDKVEYLYIYKDSTGGGDRKNVIAWRRAFTDSRDYHPVDFKSFLPQRPFTMNVYEQLKAKQLIGENGQITGNGQQVTLDFDIPLTFSHLNNGPGKDRLDSAQFDYAQFLSTISRTNNLPLDWQWIDSVSLDLGDQVNRAAGKHLRVYERGDGQASDYDTPIRTNIDNFSVCLMINRNLNPKTDYRLYDNNNVLPGCTFHVHFMFTIPEGTIRTIQKDAGFAYNFGLDDVQYKAIWGWFTPSDKMRAEEEVNMDEYLHDYPFAKRAKLPFTDPKIEVEVSTHIAGLMRMNGEYMYVLDANGKKVDATFNGKTQRETEFLRPYLNPADNSNIGDSAQTTILFNNTKELGDIERLFVNVPTYLYYKFNVTFDPVETPQIRVTPNTNVYVNTICTLPMMFDSCLFIDYADTIKGVDLSKVDIDSLVNEVEVIDTLQVSDVTVYLTAKNFIPLTLKGKVFFKDEKGQPVKDPEDPSKEFYPFVEDTIRFAPPQFVKIGGYVIPDQNNPGKTIITAKMNKKKLEALPQIKSIEYKVYADNDALKYAYDLGLDKIRLEAEDRLTIDIGVTAHIEAIINPDKK